MATNGALETSIRELAAMCRLSPRQTRRALTRLEAASLLRWERGKRDGTRSIIELNWHEVSFPQKGGASKSQADYAVDKRTSEALYTQRYKDLTKEPSRLTSSLNRNQAFSKNAKGTRQIEPARPLWGDGPAWCTRSLWSSLAGQVRRRSVELWGPYGGVATDGIMGTAARAVKAGLIEDEGELREMIRHLGGRLRASGHAIEILSDRPRAFAYLGAVARRWLRRRGKLEAEAPETVAATDWAKWQEAAFEVLDELSWTWERRSKPLGDVTPIVAKVQRAWLETPPDRLHRRGWELVEAVSLRGFELEESRWVVVAGLAGALGVPMPTPPSRTQDPFTRRLAELERQGHTEQEAWKQASREFLGGLLCR